MNLLSIINTQTQTQTQFFSPTKHPLRVLFFSVPKSFLVTVFDRNLKKKCLIGSQAQTLISFLEQYLQAFP